MAKKNKDAADSVDLGFNPKYAKILGDWGSEHADSLGPDELKKIIVDCQKSISDIEKDMEADERLKALKEEIKDLTGGFKDVQKRETAKTMYCVFRLRSLGEK